MAAPTPQEVSELIAAKERATKDSDYADTVYMDTQLIEGTRYRIRLSEAPTER